MKRVEDTEATQLSAVMRYRENRESTQIHTIALICEMKTEDIFLLGKVYPHHSKCDYHSTLTLRLPRDKRDDKYLKNVQRTHPPRLGMRSKICPTSN
jgi:hypothetical protein